jgi:DNA mismatch endonuclease (patch repair protein)
LADNVSEDVRRKTMQAIRSQKTAFENRICKELWQRGLRFRRNVKDLKGKPDISIKKYKI